jgi:FkbH-like protein
VLLKEALQLVARPARGSPYRLWLCCGFEPLHLRTFLNAHARARLAAPGGELERGVEVLAGLFGDLTGTIRKAVSQDEPVPLAVVLDWTDLDPRLGIREGYVVTPDVGASVVAEATARLQVIEQLLTTGVAKRRVVMVLPTAPLAPWLSAGLPGQEGALELELTALIGAFAARCARAGVLVAARPEGNSYDPRAHIEVGFPLPNSYSDVLAARVAALLIPATPKKGLITDLDNTLWKGIVGDDGAGSLRWSLEDKARAHGLFQQFLAGLHGQGVLLAIASKNDREPVIQALARTDLLVPAAAFFPVETSWGPKSDSVRAIARAWNIGLADIVFVDDNPLDIAEVSAALPEVECLTFPAGDLAQTLGLINTLRGRFARTTVSEEDRLRAESIRRAAEFGEAAQSADPEGLLAGLEAEVTLSFDAGSFDPRAFELLNKTNQFNLNGERWEESDFRQTLAMHGSVLCVAAYRDRFGPLGKISVMVGSLRDGLLTVRSWVMSCRAFSRRIEHSMLKGLFDRTAAQTIEMSWKATARNGPTRDLLATYFESPPTQGTLQLSHALFEQRCPPLYAKLKIE